MRQLTDEELKQVEFQILRHFDHFCKKNDLKYSLAEGTLIGAVRHKGFIPWDDDIDVIMMREDFDRFNNLYKDQRYRIIRAEDDSIFPYFFIQIADNNTIVKFRDRDKSSVHDGGVWIDVFPIDNFPDDEEEFKMTERKIFLYSKLYRWKTRKQWARNQNLWMNFLWLFFKFSMLLVSKEFLRNRIYKLMTKNNKRKTNYMGYWTNYWHHPWKFPYYVFNEITELEFEGYKFPVISGYDEYLRCEYGDYMKLPPKEKRTNKHELIAYNIN